MSDESRPTGPLPPAVPVDDPHLQPYAKHPERAQLVAALAMVVGFVGSSASASPTGWATSTQWEAVTLGVGLLGLGFGVTAWGKYLMAQGPFVEERHDFHSTEAERDAMTGRHRSSAAAWWSSGGRSSAASSPGLHGHGRSCWSSPSSARSAPSRAPAWPTTNWRKGSQLVTVDGRPVSVYDLEVGGVLTVFPKGYEGISTDQTILIRLARARDQPYR